MYALGSDPAELHDLRRDQPRRFARLERELRSRARQTQPAPRDLGEEHLSALRALGYVE
jgi:hypothetical protein